MPYTIASASLIAAPRASSPLRSSSLSQSSPSTPSLKFASASAIRLWFVGLRVLYKFVVVYAEAAQDGRWVELQGVRRLPVGLQPASHRPAEDRM